MKLKNRYLLFGSFILCLIIVSATSCSYSNNTAEPELLPFETVTIETNVQYIARDIPYYTHDASTIIIGTVQTVYDSHVNIKVDEVLKGDPQITNVTVYVDKYIVDGVSFVSGENILLFLSGNSGVYAGPFGKYIIEGDNVSSFPDFEMSLEDLKWQINNTLERECPPVSCTLHATPLIYCS